MFKYRFFVNINQKVEVLGFILQEMSVFYTYLCKDWDLIAYDTKLVILPMLILLLGLQKLNYRFKADM